MKGKFKSISKILPILMLMVFVGIAVLTPVHQAEAGYGEWSWVPHFGIIATGAQVGSSILSALKFKENAEEWIGNFILAIIYLIASFLLKIFDYLIYWAAWAVNIFLDPDIYMEVLKSSAIDTGWTICRDLCNLFFVLILLAIAFATIFRIQAYSAKALLPKFILAIFLINFSMVIATIVIDFGQILMFQFVTWMGSFGPTAGGGDDGALSCLTSISHQFVANYPMDIEVAAEKVGGVFFAAAFVFVLMFIYLILAAFLLIRLVMLGLLIVLSPFAFMAVILPGTRSHSSKWWGSLFKYVLFGPIFVFFIYLSSEMGQDLMTPGAAPTYGGITPSEYLTDPKQGGNETIFGIVVYFIKGGIVMGMLLASVFMTKSMGMIGASSLVGGTAGIGLMASKAYRGARYGAGKAKGAAGQVSKRVPAVGTRVEKAKDMYRGGLRKIGLHGAALKGEKGADETKKVKMEAVIKEYGDPAHASLDAAEAMAKSKKGDATDEKKAYYLKAKLTQGETLTQGDLKLLPTAQRSLDRKTLDEMTNKQVGLTAETTEGQKKVTKLEATGLSTEDARTKIIGDKMSELVLEGKAGKMIDLGDERVAQAWHDKQTSSQRDSSMKTMTEEQRKSLAGGYDKLTSNNYGGLTDDEKIKDLEIRVNTVKLTGDLEKAFTDAATGSSINDDSVARGVDQLKPGDIAKLDKGSIDEFAHFISNSKITNLIKSGEQGAVNDIRVSLENKRRTFAVGTAEHTLLTNKINNIVNKLTS